MQNREVHIAFNYNF